MLENQIMRQLLTDVALNTEIRLGSLPWKIPTFAEQHSFAKEAVKELVGEILVVALETAIETVENDNHHHADLFSHRNGH